MSAKTSQSRRSSDERTAQRKFFIGLARAFGGAIIFGLPLLMTMEMWSLGFSTNPLRIAVFIVLSIPLLVGLSHYSGFEETFCWEDDLVDSFVALAVGFVAAAALLLFFGVIAPGMAMREVAGKVALQAVPGSIGALLAVSILGTRDEQDEEEERFTRYEGELFLMAVGALFLGLNVAPTEEMVLLAEIMSAWHTVGLAIISLIIIHAFVYVLEFAGQSLLPEGTPILSVFLRFTIPGYAIALLISVYVLWIFGRTDGTSLHAITSAAIVLGFPAAVGAAAARLVI